MSENKVVTFPLSFRKQIDDLINSQERAIAKYRADVKKLNWFTAGLMVGIIGTFFIFTGVYYFIGIH